MKRLLLPLLALALCQPAAAATTRLDRHGTVVLDGRKVFPIALAKGPPAEGLAEVAAAGVNVLKVGPAGEWTSAELARTIAENRAAAAAGLSTWVNLSAFAQLRPGLWRESLLRNVVGTLDADPSASAIALWKGADEPWRFRMRPASLRFAYCLVTGKRRSWCAGHAPVDTGRLWVTVQAPRAGVWSLAPYAEVTDIHGVNSYPIAIGDAILNGARAIAFYGGQNPKCWGQLDAAGGWNWTYWERVLEPLVREISAASPLAPALRNPGTTRELPTSDRSVRAISRRGRNGELWVMAVRGGGEGSVDATIGGLPAAPSADVYAEDRSVSVAGGALADSFGRWAVHVYRLTAPTARSS